MTAERRRATIEDVASSAGVSRQTVSRAMNGKGEISPATRDRVLDAARRLNYRPSRFARGLVRQQVTTIGLLVTDLANPYFPQLASAVLATAEQRGWQVVVSATHGDADRELDLVDNLADQVDALVGYLAADDDAIAEHVRGLPVVLLQRDPDSTRFGAVAIDLESGTRQAVEHLVGAGHRDIAMLGSEGPDDVADVRRDAFRAVVRELGLDPARCPVHPCAQSVPDGERAAAAVLTAYPETTALFAYSDLIAVGAIRAAVREGRQVPGSCAVVGFDGLPLGELVTPALTTVHIDTWRLGELAVDQVARQLGEDNSGAAAVVVPRLLVRGSG
ncbi:LacI family DNA-binding transcriptional regulator [Kribbella sp.]|uniref:LacI family DNA-binding transcriptional regulator n=1 Tax=Kribbella sp. TaxID=1871183 RepID=UPI002D660E99|nr:LacI family DNA-binding transcriptional regulator [Kribbella sp.]HZX06404.1 LacI family DNA-binding transcriptional regulator [Kribbella sp.]